MSLSPLATTLVAELGSSVEQLDRIGGGDTSEAYAAVLGDGRRVFVKTKASAPPGFFEAEVAGLEWLAEVAALPIPEVLAYRDAPALPFLALRWVPLGVPEARFEEKLGQGLAALHAAGAPGFGWGRDGFIGSLPQVNSARSSWLAFYRECRLEPLLRATHKAGLLPAGVASRLSRLIEHLDRFVGPAEPPARLHGDLWSGNVLADAQGRPWVVDPAAYGGQREMDLAMLRLFGGIGPRVFESYAEAFPLGPGHAERVSLYQLYPLLVHVQLFGAGYVARLDRALRTYVR